MKDWRSSFRDSTQLRGGGTNGMGKKPSRIDSFPAPRFSNMIMITKAGATSMRLKPQAREEARVQGGSACCWGDLIGVALSTVSCHLLQAFAGPMLLVAYPGNAQAGA